MYVFVCYVEQFIIFYMSDICLLSDDVCYSRTTVWNVKWKDFFFLNSLYHNKKEGVKCAFLGRVLNEKEYCYAVNVNIYFI